MMKLSIDNQQFDFSITFSALAKLRYFDESHYRDFFDCYAAGEKDLTDKALLIYIAYLCANLESQDVLNEIEIYALLEKNISLIDILYNKIYSSKINYNFSAAFKKRTKKYNTKIKMPKFQLCDIEDYYCYFVLFCKIPEQTFWNCEIPFLEGVAADKNAVEGFLNYREHELLKK